MRLESDSALRNALYGLYLALFRARESCPGDFSDGRLTTILTAFMGVENAGWRVVGITREALELLSTEDFNKNKLPRRLCRGHLIDRIQTTRDLFLRDKPMELEAFFKVFLSNDLTVIMLNEQNRTKPFPDFIAIDNPHAELFPNGSLMSWKHRMQEREYLRQLHSSMVKAGGSLDGSSEGGSELEQIEQRFHTLIQSRLEEFHVPVPLELPHLEGLQATKQEPAWFAVDGMYGGFSYYLMSTKAPAKLMVESWSRVIDGSGQRHYITTTSTELVEAGFV